jgi:hypothetical protein
MCAGDRSALKLNDDYALDTETSQEHNFRVLMSRPPKDWKEFRFQIVVLLTIFAAAYGIISLAQFLRK